MYEWIPEVTGPPGEQIVQWSDLAVCRGKSELFFPPFNERPGERKRREASAHRICCTCPVLQECRAWARQHREYGYWGAESEEERAAAGYCVGLPVGAVARARRQWRRGRTSTGAEVERLHA